MEYTIRTVFVAVRRYFLFGSRKIIICASGYYLLVELFDSSVVTISLCYYFNALARFKRKICPDVAK